MSVKLFLLGCFLTYFTGLFAVKFLEGFDIFCAKTYYIIVQIKKVKTCQKLYGSSRFLFKYKEFVKNHVISVLVYSLGLGRIHEYLHSTSTCILSRVGTELYPFSAEQVYTPSSSLETGYSSYRPPTPTYSRSL